MNVADFYVGDRTKLPTTENSAVNVIYFTNKCNLACTYCYEDLANRPPQILSQEDIKTHVDKVLERESDPNTQTLFVLFGGEPTLEWDNVCFLMDYAYKKKKNVHFNLESNGIKFLSQVFIDQVMNNFFYKLGLLSIDVSFDGTGNRNRIFLNGMDSTQSMLKVFANLKKSRFKYRIRYTIHKLNARYAYEDISMIIKTFNPLRVITSVAWDTLSKKDLERLTQMKLLFRDDWINTRITVPICELFCDMCDGCGERKQLKTYFTDEGNVTTYSNYENTPKFHDFKDKEIK
jgi:sulfatase maturation enzyme AslB (radical SAM superfamily)